MYHYKLFFTHRFCWRPSMKICGVSQALYSPDLILFTGKKGVTPVLQDKT